jgi:hypothetical protein
VSSHTTGSRRSQPRQGCPGPHLLRAAFQRLACRCLPGDNRSVGQKARSGPIVQRRPWWATFSVRAHQNRRTLACDVLLYDRLILPRPADRAEHERFIREGWEPDLQELTEIQAADSIHTVIWSSALREEWKRQCRAMTGMNKDIAMGATPLVLAQTPRGQDEILAALAPNTPPEQRPIILPAFQSAAEGRAQLRLRPAGPRASAGSHPADRALALEFARLVEEPALRDPKEAFTAAAELASKDEFRRARANLLAYVDELARNEWSQADVERRLGELVEEYNTAVRDFRKYTWKRRAVMVFPMLGGAGVGAATGGVHAPVLAKASSAGASWLLRRVTGRFFPERGDPDDLHPGRALALTHAAFRDRRFRTA